MVAMFFQNAEVDKIAHIASEFLGIYIAIGFLATLVLEVTFFLKLVTLDLEIT